MDKNQAKIDNLRAAINAVEQKILHLEEHKKSLTLSLQEAELKEQRKLLSLNKLSESNNG